MSVLMMAVTISTMSAALIALAFALWTKKDWLKNFVTGGIMIWFASYAILLFAGSFIDLDVPPDTTNSRLTAQVTEDIGRIIKATFAFEDKEASNTSRITFISNHNRK